MPEPADTLRRAADELEHRAQLATKERWHVGLRASDDSPGIYHKTGVQGAVSLANFDCADPECVEDGHDDQLCNQYPSPRENADYIALVDPTVGKALALLLRTMSQLGDAYNFGKQEALAVARALLREAADADRN